MPHLPAMLLLHWRKNQKCYHYGQQIHNIATIQLPYQIRLIKELQKPQYKNENGFLNIVDGCYKVLNMKKFQIKTDVLPYQVTTTPERLEFKVLG